MSNTLPPKTTGPPPSNKSPGSGGDGGERTGRGLFNPRCPPRCRRSGPAEGFVNRRRSRRTRPTSILDAERHRRRGVLRDRVLPHGLTPFPPPGLTAVVPFHGADDRERLERRGHGSALHRPFVQLAICELAYFAAAGLTIPITPLFAEGPLGANELWVGITVGAFSLSTILLRPGPAGRRPAWPTPAADRRCAALRRDPGAHAVTTTRSVLIALRLLLGVAEAFFFVAAFAALADLAPPGGPVKR